MKNKRPLSYRLLVKCEALNYVPLDHDANVIEVFRPCGHTKRYIKGALINCKDSGIACSSCPLDDLKEKAQKVGLEYIKKSSNKDNALYKMACCGELQKFQSTQVKNLKKTYICAKCYIKLHNAKTLEFGAEYIDDQSEVNKNNGYGRYRLDCCNNNQIIKRCHVLSGNFKCKKCNKDPWQSPAKLYVAVIEKGDQTIVKVGHSICPKGRIIRFSKIDTKVHLECLFLFDKKRLAHAFEESFRRLKKIAICSLPHEKTCDILHDGFTECYEFSALLLIKDTLKDMFENVEKVLGVKNKKIGYNLSSRKLIERKKYNEIHAKRANEYDWDFLRLSKSKASYALYKCPKGHVNLKSIMSFKDKLKSYQAECRICIREKKAIKEKELINHAKTRRIYIVRCIKKDALHRIIACKKGHERVMKVRSILKFNSIYQCKDCG